MLKRCLTLVCSVYVLSLLNISDAAAKICFLPDGNCGKTKININSGENGCIYKDKGAAETGMSKCEIAFQRNSCWWRRCNSDNKTIFDKLADCQKKIEDATSQKCQACGSCYKLVPISIPQNACPDGYSTKYQSQNDCGANESFSENGTYNGLVCGACTKTETCPSGYSTLYQSKKDCKSGETFSSSGSVGNLTCGKCEKNDEVITIYLTNIETEEAINKTLTCNGHTESYGNILKESVHFSHDSTHNVNFKIYNKTREIHDKQFNKKTACSGLYDERITFNNGDTKVYAMYPDGNPEDYEIFGYYYNNYPTNYEVIVDGTTVASGSTVVSAREDVEYSLRNLHSLAGKVIEPSANNPYTIKFVYQEGEKCTPKDCSGYSAYVNGMNAEKDENLQTCDPGCGLALQYKCKDGYTYRGYGRCVSPCKRGYIDSYTNTCNDNPTCKCELREDNHSYCVKCDGTSSSTTYVAYSNNVYTGDHPSPEDYADYEDINQTVCTGSGAQCYKYSGKPWYFDILDNSSGNSVVKFTGSCKDDKSTKASIEMNKETDFTFKVYPLAYVGSIQSVTIYNTVTYEKYCFGRTSDGCTTTSEFNSNGSYSDKRLGECFDPTPSNPTLGGSGNNYVTFNVTLKPNAKYIIWADVSH